MRAETASSDRPVPHPVAPPTRRHGARLEGFGGLRPALPFLAVGVLLYGIFVFMPVIQAIVYSFMHWDGIGPKTFVGFQNYIEMFTTDPVFKGALRNTVLWTVLTIIVPNVLGLALAVALNERIRGRVVLRAAFYLPAVLSTVVVAMTWNAVYDPFVGLLNGVLEHVGLDELTRPWLGDPSTALIAVFVASAWMSTGVAMVLFLAGLQSVRADLVDAARVDGASRRNVFRHVEIPALGPTIIVVLVLSVINGLKGFDLIFAMTNGGPADSSQLLASYAWMKSIQHRDFGLGSAVATFLFVLTIITVIPYIRWTFRNLGPER